VHYIAGNEMQRIQAPPVHKPQEIFGRKKPGAYSAANVVLTGISCPPAACPLKCPSSSNPTALGPNIK
jgi:hypothetical protein